MSHENQLSPEAMTLVQECVKKQLRKYATWFGVSTVSALLLALSYVLFILPSKIASELAGTYKSRVEGAQTVVDAITMKTSERIAEQENDVAKFGEILKTAKNKLDVAQKEFQGIQNRATDLAKKQSDADTQMKLLHEKIQELNNADLSKASTLLAQLEKSPDAKTILQLLTNIQSVMPSKQKLNSFRQELYGDIADLVVKKDATTDELAKIDTEDYIKQFMRWGLQNGHGAVLRDYEQKGSKRGAMVILPAELKHKAEKIRDGKQDYSWN